MSTHRLEISRLLAPQRAVVIEGRDALGGRHEIRAALRGDADDEVDDRFLRRAIVPGGQRVCLRALWEWKAIFRCLYP
jgi:hypothetical protein